MNGNYTVTIYVAAPGTPLSSGGTSAAGHMYFQVSDGALHKSFGFAPTLSGETRGPGSVRIRDVAEYEKPFYARTIEISKAQFDKLKDFGENPEVHGFNMQYNGATNSCIDFTWSALNHAGLHRRNLFLQPDRDFDGGLKPLTNIEYIRSIKAPYPDSDLNTEKRNLMPERTLLQRFISDADLPQNDRRMLEDIRSQVAGIDKQHGREFDATSERISLGLLVEAKQQGLQRIDHVVLGTAPAGNAEQRMFAVQGRLEDPAHLRASVGIGAAVQTSPEQSYATLEALYRTQEQRALADERGPLQVQAGSPRVMG